MIGIPIGRPDPARQCECKNHRGERCKQWKAKGERFCYFHVRMHRRSYKRNKVTQRKMPKFYSKFLGKTLAETIDEQLNASPVEQFQFYEELAIMREQAGDAVKMWAVARAAAEQETVNPERKKKLEELSLQAGAIMRSHLLDVIKICETGARLEEQSKNKFSIHQLHFVVNQLVVFAHDMFGDDIEKAKIFEQMIRERLKLPKIGEEGTTLTPDMDVTAMDNTVPRA